MTFIKNTGSIKVISLIIAVVIIVILLMTFGSTNSSPKTTDSGGKIQQTEQFSEENEELPAADESMEQAAFGAVPYFDEDTNGMLQYADGWLYGYLGGSIFRMDAITGELSVLFETAGSRSMHFCIDDGYLYFLTIPQITFVDGTKADLYRMNCDGSGLVLLAEVLPVLDANIPDGDETIKMSVYEDVLYIMFNREAICLQLLDDGSVREVACEDALYRLLPDGYFAPDSYDMLPSIPYCAKHYGYFFAVNSESRLIRVDAESGLWESIPGQMDHHRGFVTYESVYLADREERKWIRYSLEDVTWSSDWREYDPRYFFYTEIIGWEENGAFLIQQEGIENAVQLVFVDWEGKETLLASFQQQILYAMPYGIEKYYIRDGWLYYRDEWEGENWLMRISCEGGEPEKLYCYYVRPGKGITESETVEKNYENTGKIRVSTSITKLWLKEGEEGAAKINAALREIYKAAEAEMEAFNQEMLDEYLFEDGALREDLDEWLPYPLDEWLALITENYVAFIEYADENYLCLCMTGDIYTGGAHGYYWDNYYVFDRHTGKRLSLEDFVSNSPEEIKEIIKNHILAVAPYSDGEQSEGALEQDRFFLTAEGLGIHYDVYEIGSYASGPCDLIIPFELFDMKEGMWRQFFPLEKTGNQPEDSVSQLNLQKTENDQGNLASEDIENVDIAGVESFVDEYYKGSEQLPEEIIKQIEIYVNQREVWLPKPQKYMPDYHYAWNDLNLDGSLELICSYYQGTGWYSTSYVYAMNSSGEVECVAEFDREDAPDLLWGLELYAEVPKEGQASKHFYIRTGDVIHDERYLYRTDTVVIFTAELTEWQQERIRSCIKEYSDVTHSELVDVQYQGLERESISWEEWEHLEEEFLKDKEYITAGFVWDRLWPYTYYAYGETVEITLSDKELGEALEALYISWQGL